MPTYQYACTSCGEQLEAVQKFSDDPLTECPACGGRLRKVFSAVGVVFKGSGFYKTDSRSAGSKKDDKPAGTASEKSSSADKASPEKSRADKSSADKSSPSTSSSDKPSASSSGQVA